MSEKRFCRYCGVEVQSDSLVCPSCGKSIEEVTPPTTGSAGGGSPGPIKSTQTRKKGLTIVLVIVVLGVLCCLAIVFTSQVLVPMVNEQSNSRATQTAEKVQIDYQFTVTAEAARITETAQMEIIALKTEAVRQGNIARDWGVPILMLITAEKHADDLISKLTMVEDKMFTKDEMANQMAIPDSFDLVMIWFSEIEMVESKLSNMGLEITPTVKPFFMGLKDDYENLTFLELYWISGTKDHYQTMDDLNREKEALDTEREKIHQAMLMNGMNEEVYATTIAYYEKEWPGFKMKLDALGLKILTPEPE